MKKSQILLLLLLPFLFTCQQTGNEEDIEKWKAEIVETEQKFNDLAGEEGLAEAFAVYAAEDGVIKRGGKLVKGRKAIGQWYEENGDPNATLTWKPDFVEVSKSGDLAYTYGGFVYTSVDSAGVTEESTGVFHTVWKRQEDGNWRFVWD